MFGLIALIIHHRRTRAFQNLAARRILTYHHEAGYDVQLPLDFISEIESGVVVNSVIRRALTGHIDGFDVSPPRSSAIVNAPPAANEATPR